MTCPSCKHKNPHGQKFCGNCGTRLGPPTGKKETERVEWITATLLVADLAGFPIMAEGMKPEDAVQLLARSLELLEGVVHKYEGTAVRSSGEGFLALFGLQGGANKGPEQALRAAMEMPGVLEEIAKDLIPKLGLTVGVHQGEVIYSAGGGKDSKGALVLGEAVRLARGLREAAQSGEILVSERIAKAGDRLFECEALPAIPVKGLKEAQAAHRLLGIRRAGIGRAVTPLSDREEELDEMKTWARECLDGKGGILCLVGEAGMGKSRLKFELRRYLSERHAEVVESRALSYGRGFAYWVFLEALRELLRLGPQEGRAEIHARLSVLGGVLELGSQDAEHIAWLLHAELPNGPASQLSGSSKKAAAFLAMKRLVLTLAERRPLVMILEDMQWSDPLSRELLTFLVRAIPGSPVLLVCLYRPEYEPEWIASPQVKVIPVAELRLEDIRQLMANLLGWEDVPPDLAQAVLSRVEGNPFYLEELLRSLSEQGILAWRGERCERVGRLDEAEIPDTLQTLVASRIERLSEPERRALQAAAVIGRSFPVSLLERVCQEAHLDCREALVRLEEAGMVFLHARDGEPEYHFKQLITRDAAYLTLTRAKARELHRDVARAIEAVYPDRIHDFVELLAWHYSEAEEGRKEIDYLLRSGDKHLEALQGSEAVRAYGQALEILLQETSAGPMSPAEERERRFQAHFGRAKAYELMGYFTEAAPDGEHALEAAEALGDARKMVSILMALSGIKRQMGQASEALSYADRALKVAEAGGRKSLVVQSLIQVGLAHRDLGSVERAAPLFEQAAETQRKIGDRELLATSLAQLGALEANQGQFQKALSLFEEALTIRRDLGDPLGQAELLMNIGSLRSRKGDLVGALSAFEGSLEIQRELGDKPGIAASLVQLGGVLAGHGDLGGALKAYQESVSLYREFGDRRSLAASLTSSGGVLRTLGSVAEALETHEEAFLIQMQLGDRFGMGASLAVIADLHLQAGRYEDALRAQNEAIALHRELRNSLELAADLARLGEILLRLERPPEAQARVEEGLTLAAGLSSRHVRANLLVTLGNIKTILGEADDAWDAIVEGMDLARELGLQAVVVKGWVALGDLALKKGDGKESRKCYEAAFDSAKVAKMEYWAKELEKKLGFEEKGGEAPQGKESAS